MNKFSLNSYSSIEWLKAGKILVHPTESVWGLGCDAFNEKAVDKIFKIKKRKRNKNFILLSESLNSVKQYVKKINKDDEDYLSKYWPGAYTFLIQYNENLPKHLHNQTSKVAVRVSNHLPIKNLFKGFEGLIISTSANISGKENINDPVKILDFFEYEEMAYYDECLGKNTSASKIIDLETKTIIRN